MEWASQGVRRWEGLLVLAAAAVGIRQGAGCEPAGFGGRRPNVIVIMADDLGVGDLGCYGQPLIQTPRIDRMATEGMRFTQAYAGAPVCAPSRCVLMTGLHTGHARIRDNSSRIGGVADEISPASAGRRIPPGDEDVTIAEVLKQAGYATGITGKWGLGEGGTPGVPSRQGFDEWYGFLNQNHAADHFPEYLWRNDRREFLEGNRARGRGQYANDLFTEFALDFIRRHHDRPFFLYVPFTIPHAELEVPSQEPYADRAWPEEAKTFAAMITRMDRDVVADHPDVAQALAAALEAAREESPHWPDSGHHGAGGRDHDGSSSPSGIRPAEPPRPASSSGSRPRPTTRLPKA